MKKKLAIMTPTYKFQFDMSYLIAQQQAVAWAHQNKLPFEITWNALGNIGATVRMRNSLIAQAMADGATDLLFVDSDIGFPPDALQILVDSNLPVLGAAQPVRDDRHFPYGLVALSEEGPNGGRRVVISPDENGIAEVYNLPTAFLRIKREVIEHLMEAYPELRYVEYVSMDVPDGKGGLKKDKVKQEPYLLFNYRVEENQEGEPTCGGEDYGFMTLLREQGIPVHVHTGMPLMHGRLHSPGGNLYRYMQQRGMQEKIDTDIVKLPTTAVKLPTS